MYPPSNQLWKLYTHRFLTVWIASHTLHRFATILLYLPAKKLSNKSHISAYTCCIYHHDPLPNTKRKQTFRIVPNQKSTFKISTCRLAFAEKKKHPRVPVIRMRPSFARFSKGTLHKFPSIAVENEIIELWRKRSQKRRRYFCVGVRSRLYYSLKLHSASERTPSQRFSGEIVKWQFKNDVVIVHSGVRMHFRNPYDVI